MKRIKKIVFYTKNKEIEKGKRKWAQLVSFCHQNRKLLGEMKTLLHVLKANIIKIDKKHCFDDSSSKDAFFGTYSKWSPLC